MGDVSLDAAMDAVPPGRWGVGVSGGADSVALLELLKRRTDLFLHIVHLDHETRAGASTADAEFVRQIAANSSLPITVAARSQIEPALANLPRNTSARYRAVRLKLFRRAIHEHDLRGVILAHHADDQAETVFQRLLRGSGPSGLMGMPAVAEVSGVTTLRPLLRVHRQSLRDMLHERGIVWREDASNQSPYQLRNRIRPILALRPELVSSLIDLADACRELNGWVQAESPVLSNPFNVIDLQKLPEPLARESARRWLAERAGVDVEISASSANQLIEMANDAASPARQDFPGGVKVRRRGGKVFVESTKA